MYRDFKNDYLKAYEPGATTPKVIALDSAGVVQVAKLQLNADGFIISAGNAIVIPYIDGDYDLWLFPTEAEADSNDTSNAVRLADNLSAPGSELVNDLSQAYEFATVAAFKASLIEFPDGKTIRLLDRGADFTKISGTGTGNDMDIIASTTISQSITIIDEGSISLSNLGGVDSINLDQTSIIQRLFDSPFKDITLDIKTGTNKLTIPPDKIIRVTANSHIKALPGYTGLPSAVMISWGAVSNTEMICEQGHIFEMRKSEFTSEPEFSHCFDFIGSTDCIIRDPYSLNATGDGFRIEENTNLKMIRPRALNSRRNCFSYISGQDDVIFEPVGIGASGLAPQAGFDIEPGNATDIIANLQVIRPVMKDNVTGGLAIYLNKIVGALTADFDISIVDPICSGNGVNLSVARVKTITTRLTISITNPILSNSGSRSLEVDKVGTGSGRLDITGVKIDGVNLDDNASVFERNAIFIASDGTVPIGGDINIDVDYIRGDPALMDYGVYIVGDFSNLDLAIKRVQGANLGNIQLNTAGPQDELLTNTSTFKVDNPKIIEYPSGGFTMTSLVDGNVHRTTDQSFAVSAFAGHVIVAGMSYTAEVGGVGINLKLNAALVSAGHTIVGGLVQAAGTDLGARCSLKFLGDKLWVFVPVYGAWVFT